jgi:flagellin FlaB
MTGKWKRLIGILHRDERGITGLETAIILIAFVVIASIFAYSVLSAGMFSSERGKEAIYGAIEEARSTLSLDGSVVAVSNGTTLTSLIFTVTTALGGEAVDLTSPNDVDADGIADSGSSNVTVVSYYSDLIRTDDLDWAKTDVGRTDSDSLLEAGEAMEITVDLTGAGETIGTYKEFNIEVKPPRGAVLKITRTTPGALDSYMLLQ